MRDDPRAHLGAMPSRPSITIALDAGGTVLKAALLVNGQLIPGSFRTQPANAQDSAVKIIEGFAAVCHELLTDYDSTCRKLDDRDRVRIGLAVPGPFDYREGIALLKDVGKYESLYGLSVRDLLRSQFRLLGSRQADIMLNHLAGADIRFGNDAFMFGLGAGLRFPSERLICLTLGTGLGSAFIEHGRIVSGRKGIPSSGMLFAEPFEEGIVDSYFGRRGILKLASERGLLTEGVDVVDLAATAAGGDTSRLELFRTYGRRMGEMLLPYISEFGPSRLILGGQISRSLPLWDQSLSQALGEHAIPVHCLDQDGMSTVFMGIEQLFGDMENEPYVPLFNK